MANEFARRLRRNQTKAEWLLWSRLRDRQVDGYKFRRQRPIGRYVADFVCMERQLVIEIDGGQHARRVDRDQRRTATLERQGYRVIRFWNNDVLENVEGVLESIQRELRK